MMYTYIFINALFNIYMFLIQILFTCSLERIMHSSDARFMRFCYYSYLIYLPSVFPYINIIQYYTYLL